VKRVAAGERISYGLTHRFDRDTTVATVPIGYADGVPRRLSSTGGAVLIGGRRRPIVGVVTMDQLMVDCGDDPVAAGDDVVLLGAQGDERIRPEEWADRLGTIGYEIVCGIGPRVPRTYR
jgi:alanine racemase